jgi:hypothetical protein
MQREEGLERECQGTVLEWEGKATRGAGGVFVANCMAVCCWEWTRGERSAQGVRCMGLAEKKPACVGWGRFECKACLSEAKEEESSEEDEVDRG